MIGVALGGALGSLNPAQRRPDQLGRGWVWKPARLVDHEERVHPAHEGRHAETVGMLCDVCELNRGRESGTGRLSTPATFKLRHLRSS
jgi:hypothetical protein